MARTVISKEIQFDAGHRVATHSGKCRSPHGHRYRVEVSVAGRVNQDVTSTEYGMVADFSVLKQILNARIHDPYDHAFILWKGDQLMWDFFQNAPAFKFVVIPVQPTAEGLAALFFDDLVRSLGRRELEVVEVNVWETPTSYATYPW